MYTAKGQIDREQLVEQYAPLVKRIAYHLVARLPSNVQLEDLVQYGMIGLLDACERYREGLGAQFETYASQRIRGAMMDSLREGDALPRHTRREMRRVEIMLHQLEHQYGRPPSETELADALSMPLEDYQRLMQEARGHQILYLEDFEEDLSDANFLDRNYGDSEMDPAALFEDQTLRQNLARAISELPEREQLVMALYYDEELNQREIGEVMGITESRVCQLHSQAVSRLRVYLLSMDNPSGKRRRRRRRESGG
ncbi:MAG: RNA polymerase sigma factor FliA [Zoogloeaceae bacterium]|jgi:RNA polymerase sigma factor for flagellar operon FliA|nr:RNA polymerase sigma factor FliA [Zoogloeaceae bacterium]